MCPQDKSSENTLENGEIAGHDGHLSLYWLIRKIPPYQTLQYSGIGLKCETPKTGLKLVAMILMFSNKKISTDFTIYTHVNLVTLGDKFDHRAIIYNSC